MTENNKYTYNLNTAHQKSRFSQKLDFLVFGIQMVTGYNTFRQTQKENIRGFSVAYLIGTERRGKSFAQ